MTTLNSVVLAVKGVFGGDIAHSRILHSRVAKAAGECFVKSSGCGAGSEGSRGFQPGNTCGNGDGSGSDGSGSGAGGVMPSQRKDPMADNTWVWSGPERSDPADNQWARGGPEPSDFPSTYRGADDDRPRASGGDGEPSDFPSTYRGEEGEGAYLKDMRSMQEDFIAEEARKRSDSLMQLIKEKGGFTIHPVSGSTPKKGFSVSVFPQYEKKMSASELTNDVLADHLLNGLEMAADDPRVHVGAWYNASQFGNASPDDMVYLDLTVVLDDHAEAVEFARKHGQLGIFDLENFQVIETMTPDERSEWESAQKEVYGSKEESKFDDSSMGSGGWQPERDPIAETDLASGGWQSDPMTYEEHKFIERWKEDSHGREQA